MILMTSTAFLVQIYIYGLNFNIIGCISIFKGAVPQSPPPYVTTKEIGITSIVFLVHIYMYGLDFIKIGCIWILERERGEAQGLHLP